MSHDAQSLPLHGLAVATLKLTNGDQIFEMQTGKSISEAM
jgi:hypothetical protein